jgi:hypothetical protein
MKHRLHQREAFLGRTREDSGMVYPYKKAPFYKLDYSKNGTILLAYQGLYTILEIGGISYELFRNPPIVV